MERARRLDARWLALIAATGIVFYLCWLMLEPFVDVLLWGVVLAMVAWPINRRLRAKGNSEHVAALMTTALVVVVVLIPLTLVTAAVVRQGADAVESMHGGVRSILDPAAEPFRTIDRYLDLDPLRDPKVLAARLGDVGGRIASRSLGIIGGVLGGVVQVFFVLFTLYYLLRDADRIVPGIRRSLPLTPLQADTIFARTGDVIAASVNGVLVIAAIQGTLGMIGFLILGLPSALLWGFVMFLLSTIPMVGSAVIWAPAAIYLAATGHWFKAGFLAVWGGVVIGLIDNVLRPRLVGKRAKLHELIIFFSVLGGLRVFGVLGLFVGPVVAAIALALVDVFRHTESGADEKAGGTPGTPEATEGQTRMSAPPSDVVITEPSGPRASAAALPGETASSGR